ncbi:CATRA conflict system CASPASE/TPR repeat-associated protein [Streptomyces sp. NPDC008317]|uniref:CATRA conflict system CASPASE/TPR repeat-associated protein n=1 Tax=Streptomyces sp. NPDC008317 TaxID=3364827 RepID=UPI0036EB011A
MRGIVKPALLIACFAPTASADDESAHAYLNDLWQACRALGMTSPITGLPFHAARLPAIPGHTKDLEILAAAERGGATSVHSAFVFAEHDTVGLIALLAPNDTHSGLEQWNDLLTEWNTAVASTGRPAAGPPPDGILGEFRVFEALRRRTVGVNDHTVCEEIRRYGPPVPGPGSVSGTGSGATGFGATASGSGRDGAWWRGFDRTDHGFDVWRPEEDPAHDAVSHLYVLAPAALEAELDAWAWAVDGESGLRPLTRYLLHASKLRYEARQYAADEPVHVPVEVSERHTRELLRELEPAASGQPIALGRVLRAAALLDGTQLGAQGMTWTITGLRQLSRTVAIAAANMRIHAPVVHRRGPGASWPEADLAAAEALIAQAESDQVYLETTRERAEAARALATTIVDRAFDDRRGKLTLIQGSVLGAAATALAAVQSFSYHVPLSRFLQSPTIAVLTALALALPLTVLRWAGVRATTSYAWLVSWAAGLVGASLCWLVTVLVRRHLDLGPLPVAVTLPCAVVSGLIAYGASRWLTRRH